jgi:hypothetical protein
MGTSLKPGRVVRVEIIVDAEDPAGDEDLDRCLIALGGTLLDRGHQNVMRAELLIPREAREDEERKEEITKHMN